MKFILEFLRFALFWAIPVFVVIAAERLWPFVDYSLAGNTIVAAVHGNIDLVSEPAFAYALAGILAFTAAMGKNAYRGHDVAEEGVDAEEDEDEIEAELTMAAAE